MSSDELATNESSSGLDEESSSSDDSDRSEHSSSTNNDESSDSDSADEIEIPEDYEPEEGVDSDNDRNECCRLRSTQETEHSRICKRRSIPGMGGPYQRYPIKTSSSDLAELVLDETFIDRAIRCTNYHGERDARFLGLINKTFGESKIPCNDKGINFFEGFFALKIYAGLMGIKSMQEAWSKKDLLKAYPGLQNVLTFKIYNRVRKHVRVTNTDELPVRNDPGYYPLQNVNWALAYLRVKHNFCGLWEKCYVLTRTMLKSLKEEFLQDERARKTHKRGLNSNKIGRSRRK